jgi:hypothetical protein
LLFLITWANIELLRLWNTNEGEGENFSFFTQLICFYINFILDGLMWINLLNVDQIVQCGSLLWLIVENHSSNSCSNLGGGLGKQIALISLV